MTFDQLVEVVGGLPYFDLPLIMQMLGGDRESTRVQLSRWMAAGKLIGLRRGYYTLAEPFRRVAIAPEALASDLHRPSYLSTLWALGFYDLIPEKVAWFTSVTSRSPCRYENAAGVFTYQHLSRQRFFGYIRAEVGAGVFFVAEPEKAILDHWHLSPGPWTQARLAEMRYQQVQKINPQRLDTYARRMDSPRLSRAAELFLRHVVGQEQGETEL